MLALAVAPHSCRCLFVGCGVPVRVEQDEPVGTDEVEAAATGLAAQEEHKVAFGAVTEVIHLQSIWCDISISHELRPGMVQRARAVP